MANATRVRVELKRKYNDPDRNFKEMLHEFNRSVNNAGIMHSFKEHQYFESKAERNRKKKREASKQQQLETVEAKVMRGEPVKCSAGVLKKAMLNNQKKKG